MDTLLKDLLDHQAWADAEVWRTLHAQPSAFQDASVWERLHHIHLVQRAFLSMARGEDVTITKPEDFTPATLFQDVRATHAELAALLPSLGEARLGEVLDVPWFRGQPGQVTVREGLVQAALHSLGHRAQNATRLRELGGSPWSGDFVWWLALGRPRPAWD